MSASTFSLLVALGVAVGAVGTLVGAGGGFVLTPILLLLYPHDAPATITAISLVVVFFNAASGSAAYARQRRIDLRSGTAFALAGLPGSILGALLVSHVSRRVFGPIMGVLLGAVAVAILAVRESEGDAAGSASGSLRRLVARDGTTYEYAVPVRRGVALSTLVGFVSSFLGIGGGVVHVPLMVVVLGFPVHVATATSHFVLAIMTAGGSLTHVFAGDFAHGHGVHRAVALSIGVVGGAQLGALASRRVHGHVIQRILGIALLGLAVRLLFPFL